MKKRPWIFLFLFFIQPIGAEDLPISVHAESAVIINAETGALIYEKNAGAVCFPASTTKMATALYALHLSRNCLSRNMTASSEAIASITPLAKRQSNYRSPSHWLETDGTHIGIKKGEVFRFYDLLFAMLVSSANDASNVIAQNLGGTIPKFMANMNQFLKEIGCKNTSFNNPHGLHHPEHTTTALDLACIAKEGMRDPLFRKIVSTPQYTCPKTNLEYERTFKQTNLLLRNGPFRYSKAIGIKTGTTLAAGKNLIAAAVDGERTLIGVFLGYRGAREDLYREVIKAFETVFKEKKMRRHLIAAGPQNFTKEIKGAAGLLKTKLATSLYYDFYPSEDVPVKMTISWNDLCLPLKANDQVASLKVIDPKGLVISEAFLLAEKDVNPSLWYKAMHHKNGRKTLFFLSSFSFLFFIWKIRKKPR